MTLMTEAPMTNIRNCLAPISRTSTTHPGLWMDKYLKDHEPGSKQELVQHVATLAVPNEYDNFYTRWTDALAQRTDVKTKTATVLGRLSVGLGGEAVLETAITLHRTYGVPYIPGSALKGLAANYARNKLTEEDWRDTSDAYKTMFGDTKAAGYVTFFDALYVPGSGSQHKPLWPDVITVHHPNYYQGNEPPADWDSPTPVSFMSATGKYLLAIGGPEQWVTKAFEILTWALAEEGIGAKTSSGYGRIKIDGMGTVAEATGGSVANVVSADPEQAIVEQFCLELDQMPAQQVASRISTVAQRWQALNIPPAQKLLIAQAILKKVEDAKRTKSSQGKPWFVELVSYVQLGDQP